MQPKLPNTSDAPHALDDATRAMMQEIREIHAAVTASPQSGRMQVLTAIVLSLATLASTWCGYQASCWSSVQSSMQSEADTAERQSAENTLAGLQIRTQDGMVVLEYWRAMRSRDSQEAQTLLLHMRPELRKALEASVAAGILTNPAVPGPLQQPEYVLEAETDAKADRESARGYQAQANIADKVSSEYILLTLMLASTLFFGGIATTFQRPAIRRTLALIALLVFTLAMVRMGPLPIQWPSGQSQFAPRPASAAPLTPTT
ncbi:MAG TPA: hypothetical protein VK176_10455 [Phycisphaerales bacterium]|nr:hypothetical protein [Phycisphaerales bacterium]